MPLTVRPAAREDVPALVRLRLANAEAHVHLDPATHRLPDPHAVRRHFEQQVSCGSAPLVFVAEVDGRVAGMAELVIRADPPDHQMLIPRRGADIHTVVLSGHRGHGVGRALVARVEQVAARMGIVELNAPVLAGNDRALGFYSSAGYGQRGTILRKHLDAS